MPAKKKTEKPESTDLVPVAEQPITVQTLSKLIDTPTIPDRYESVGDMIATILVGREAGIGEMTALNNLYLVNGTVSMSAKLMAGMIFAKGHHMEMKTSAKDGAEVKAYRRDPYTNKLLLVATFTFGPADAKRAGLDQKDTYEDYPAHMFLNRAVSMAGRMVYSDVLSGIGYVPEEVAIDVDSVEGVEVPVHAVLVESLDDTSDVIEVEALMDEFDAEEVS
jgi:hypothetical protein